MTSFSKYKTFSILDATYTGGGKTVRALNRNSGSGYLHIFPNYELCHEMASRNSNAYVLHGRPQLCDKIDESIYDFIIPNCKGCQSISVCDFFRQKEEGLGKDIYTVPQNLELALSWFKPETIVIDDVSLIDLIYPHEDVSLIDLQKLNAFLKGDFPLLAELTALIIEKVDFLEDVGKEILAFVRRHRDELNKEYFNLSEQWEIIRDNKIKAKFLPLLIKAKKAWIFGLFKETGERVVRICVKRFDKRNFRDKRIEVLNATPQEIEARLLKEISTYPVKIIREDAPIRRSTTILQLADSKFASFDVKSGRNVKFNRINEILDEFFAKTPKEPIVLFTSNSCKKIIKRCYKNLFSREKRRERRSEIFSDAYTSKNNNEYSLIPILLHGEGSSGTNTLINISKSIISGISFLPPSFFIRPPYIEDFGKFKVLIGEKISKNRTLFSEYEKIKRAYKNEGENRGRINLRAYVNIMYNLIQAYGIDTEVPVRNSVIQAIARVARGEDVPKLIIIVSNIKIDREGFIPQIGCFVKKIRIGNFPKRNSDDYERKARNWANPLIDELKKWYKPILERIIEKEKRKINKLTREKAEMLAKKYGVFSWCWFYRRLKEDDEDRLRGNFVMLWNAYTRLYFEIYPDALTVPHFDDRDELWLRYKFLKNQLTRKGKEKFISETIEAVASAMDS